MIIVNALLFSLLSLLACVSPILTFARLWQMKEWRIDRLVSHCRENGWWVSIFGQLRPPVVIVVLALSFVPTIPSPELIGLFVLAGMSVAQGLLRRQPMPVRTAKALSITAISMALVFLVSCVGIVIVGSTAPAWNRALLRALIVLPVLSPILVACVWMFLKPIDLWLKNRIVVRAMRIRSEHPHLTVIGITGSVGKTTTKALLGHVLEPLGATTTPMHVNTELGVAAWLTKVLQHEPADSKKILIVEMGAYRLGEIALLTKIAQPTIGVLCLVGRQHSALFGGEENIAKAKSELLAGLPKDGHAFVNADSPLLPIIKKYVRSGVTYIGTDTHAEVRALDIEETGEGISFRSEDETYMVPLAGTHNVTNILLAVSVAKKLGIPTESIQEKLKTFTAFERTFERKEVNGIVILDNTYNASVESFFASVEWARNQPGKEKVLLFDGIIELGDDEERLHRLVAEKAAEVFTRAYVVHDRFLPYFSCFGERIRTLPVSLEPLERGTVLVCMGRMSPKIVNRFLRSSPERR